MLQFGGAATATSPVLTSVNDLKPETVTGGKFYQPGVGDETTNPNNYFAADWVLGRAAVTLLPRVNADVAFPGIPVLGQPGNVPVYRTFSQTLANETAISFTGAETTVTAASVYDNTAGDPQDWVPRDAAITGVPFTSGLDTAASIWLGQPGNQALLPTGSIGTNETTNYNPTLFKGLLRSYYRLQAANDWWQRSMLENGALTMPLRFNAVQAFNKPVGTEGILTTTDKGALQSTYLAKGCTQFIVEFAGDFCTQSNGTSGTYGPDGEIDWCIDAAGKRGIRWYGFQRDIDGDGQVVNNAASPDVMPVSMFTGSAVAFEKASTPTEYIVAFGPREMYPSGGLPERSVRPWLIRITVTLTDPAGNLPTGFTREYVFKVRVNAERRLPPPAAGVRQTDRSSTMFSRPDPSLPPTHHVARRTHARRERGVVLIFTVAVLVLLAVIATTYLATVRVDRVNSEVKGGPGGGNTSPEVGLPTDELVLDVFNFGTAANGANNYANWMYRSSLTTGTSYRDFDFLDENNLYFANDTSSSFSTRQAYDPWLASREPLAYNGSAFSFVGGAGYNPAWPRISRWIERWDGGWVFGTEATAGNFESPWSGGGLTGGFRSRAAAVPTYVRIDYDLAYNTPADYAGKSVIYPGIAFTQGADAGKVALAADADGDGVADACLFPLNNWIDASGTPKFPDETIPAGYYPLDPNPHNRRWYAAVRIVDNSAAINVNTAWRRNVDMKFPATADQGSQAFPTVNVAPNYGFFRSNIGLYELLPGLTGGSAAAPTQWDVFMAYRLGASPAAISSNTGRTDYVFSTLGEALEMNLGRRPFNPSSTSGARTRSYAESLTAGLAFAGGLINPGDSRSALEDETTGLYRDAYQNVPNWGASDTVDTDKATRSFSFFAAPENVLTGAGIYPPTLWWHSIYNPDTASRSTYFSGLSAYGGSLPAQPVRHLLTTANAQSTSSRPTPTAASGIWLIPDNATQYGMTPFPTGTNPKAGINTDTFGVLWRNFFMTMAGPDSTVTPVPAAAAPADIVVNGRSVSITADEALYLRSAMAAVNAIDQRDGDNNITTYRFTYNGKYFMVAGAEQQLFIVAIEPDGPGCKVTLKNPYANTLVTDCYSIAYRPAGGSYIAPAVQVPAGTVTSGGVVQASLPAPPAGTGDIVLIRTRRESGQVSVSTDPKNLYDENVLDQRVCVDLVKVGNFTAISTSYSRDAMTWKLASTGSGDWNGTIGAVANPVNLDNRPTGVAPANVATGNKFPLSGFPRNGDMLMLPYVGHYAVYQSAAATSPIADVTPITLDVQSVPAPGLNQLAGRFTPLASTTTPKTFTGDWRSRILDNFTTLGNPMSDALPNIAADSWLRNLSVRAPDPVVGNDPSIPDVTSPVHGLININTASYRVLQMVPFVTNTAGVMANAGDTGNNDTIAQAVLTERLTNGPYLSTLDLVARVPALQTALNNANNAQGQFLATNVAGGTADADLVACINQYQGFMRISNLVSTRSDSFTVYVLLQQWQDFGTAKPVLVPGTEKRFAAVVDRSQLRDVQLKSKPILDGLLRIESVPTN
ncbi:MAG: hypothetical protein QM754_06090 [Tepidisphaeraceae bacterium]